MDAVILAAGLGSRLQSLFAVKPLASVCGMSLIELAIRQAAGAGVKRVVVVTGYAAEDVEAALPAIANRVGITVTAQRTADYERPNGFSVMAGASQVQGAYLLMMADHILSATILQRLARQPVAGRDVTLAIDRRMHSPLIDPADATFVRLAPGGLIDGIGKGIEPRDAVDCGAFLATPKLAPAIASAIADGRPGSLSDGMQWLADRGRAATMDVGDAWWIDVDDPRALRLAEAQVADHVPAVSHPHQTGVRLRDAAAR